MLNAVPSESTQEDPEDKKIPFQSVSEDIWDKKYRLKSKKGDFIDKDINGTYARVAKALADVEDPKNSFSPATFVLSNFRISSILSLVPPNIKE